MQPYVIRQGDFLALLAHKFGFDADTVWNDPSNASLRALRPDPNILWPTDVLYIPDPPATPAPGQSLAPGSTNNFVSTAPTLPLQLRFMDPELASQPFTVVELPQLTGLTTGADGSIGLQVPVTQGTFTIVFTSDGTTFSCNVGGVDPVTTLSGVIQRLQNLGYLDPSDSVSSSDLDAIRTALRQFRTDGGLAPPAPASSASASSAPDSSASGPSSAPASGGASSDNSTMTPDAPASQPAPSPVDPFTAITMAASSSGAAPASQPSPASSPSSPPPSSQPPPSQPASNSDPAPLSQPPSSSQPPPSSGSPASGAATVDNAGLDDAGTLDDATAQALVTAHGS